MIVRDAIGVEGDKASRMAPPCDSGGAAVYPVRPAARIVHLHDPAARGRRKNAKSARSGVSAFQLRDSDAAVPQSTRKVHARLPSDFYSPPLGVPLPASDFRLPTSD